MLKKAGRKKTGRDLWQEKWRFADAAVFGIINHRKNPGTTNRKGRVGGIMMKRLLVWIMMLSILFGIAGCSKRDTAGKYLLDEERNEAVINDAGTAS